MSELEELSRAAARKLPNEWDALVAECGKVVWLHESTAACAQIMVRVLWPKCIYVMHAGMAKQVLAMKLMANSPDELIAFSERDYISDPMQAFRTAVLRAVVAL